MRASTTCTPAFARRSWISLLQLGGGFRNVAAQAHLTGYVGIVGVGRGHGAQRGFALHLHEVFVAVHLEDCFGCVHYLPDDYGCDFDRIAIEIIHFQLGGFEISHA